MPFVMKAPVVHESTFYVIREGEKPGEGKYLSDEDGFVRDFEEAYHMKTEWEAQQTIEGIGDTIPARIVKVSTRWVEDEQGT